MDKLVGSICIQNFCQKSALKAVKSAVHVAGEQDKHCSVQATHRTVPYGMVGISQYLGYNALYGVCDVAIIDQSES